MGFVGEKNKASVYSSTPLDRNASRNSEALLTDLEKKDLAYKRRIRIFRLLSRIFSLFLNAYMVGSMSYALAKYYLTRNRILPGNSHPWATPTVLWPTFMLLGIATVTFLLNFITVSAYVCCGFSGANKLDSLMSKIGYVMLAGHVVAWAVATGLFKMANTGKDLWGYSCSPTADQIEDEVKAYMNFGTLCNLQMGSWAVSIIETATYAITFSVAILMVRRMAHKKKLERVKSMLLEERNVYSPEVGTMHNTNKGSKYMPVAVESPHV